MLSIYSVFHMRIPSFEKRRLDKEVFLHAQMSPVYSIKYSFILQKNKGMEGFLKGQT